MIKYDTEYITFASIMADTDVSEILSNEAQQPAPETFK